MSYTDDYEKLMRLILDGPPLTRQEISDRLGFGLSVTGIMLETLVRSDQIEKRKSFESGVKNYRFHPKGI
jgi:hypothetical protein